MTDSLRSARKIGSQIVLSLVIAVIAVWTVNRYQRLSHFNFFSTPTADKVLMTRWQDDLTALDGARGLPVGFKDLKKVVLITTNGSIRAAYRKFPLALDRNPHGKFNLEIFADEIEGGAIVIQYDLVDGKSGNTIWELGRTFPGGANQPAPSGSPSP